MQKRAGSIFMFGFVGIPRSNFKVMVKLICDISTSGSDRNMNMSILMFGFMGIPEAGLFIFKVK
jgi:hypothetical protein